MSLTGLSAVLEDSSHQQTLEVVLKRLQIDNQVLSSSSFFVLKNFSLFRTIKILLHFFAAVSTRRESTACFPSYLPQPPCHQVCRRASFFRAKICRPMPQSRVR